MYRTAAFALLVAFPFAGSVTGQGFGFDYHPTQREVVLDTDDTVITPANGAPVRVRGGIFVFRSVTIPAGVTVRGVGSRPMVWLVSQDFRVDGRLTVDGEDGQPVNVLNSANFPTPGGMGGAGGGDGGYGSPLWFARSPFGQPGTGPLQLFAFGGGGGQLSCTPSCGRGSGGGGGSFATSGDPDYLLGGTSWTQVTGQGGEGCLNRTLPGGLPGQRPFVDGRHDNDFLGVGVDFFGRRAIRGELPFPIGGSGGGGGGDRAPNCSLTDPNFVSDNMGGGGGGGGGALVILALGRVMVGPQGYVTADGGHGGGGEQAGSNNQGGGGGGGSGGMIVLLGARGIVLHVKGDTYANDRQGDFVLSADGGIGSQGPFTGLPISDKYPTGNTSWGQKPAGGFGGLGVIQLITRPGANADGTNTIFDDGIDLYRAGVLLTGAAKTRFLGWRGYPDATGTLVDDFGRPTQVGRGHGDLRPDPKLLPLF